MQNQIPTWGLCGAVILAFSAGILNTTALMGFTHVSASHVTGNVSLVAVTFFHHDWENVRLFIISIASFWVGSVFSGMIIGGSELHAKRHYGYAMYLEFVLLCGSLWLYLSGNEYGQMLIAMACGLQNSMVATYHGAVVRTTHLTGITSDLGATVGHWLMGRKISLAKVVLQSALWWGFFAGGAVAIWLYTKYGYWSMLLPIVIILTSAVSYEYMEKWFNKSHRMIRFVMIKRKRRR